MAFLLLCPLGCPPHLSAAPDIRLVNYLFLLFGGSQRQLQVTQTVFFASIFWRCLACILLCFKICFVYMNALLFGKCMSVLFLVVCTNNMHFWQSCTIVKLLFHPYLYIFTREIALQPVICTFANMLAVPRKHRN